MRSSALQYERIAVTGLVTRVILLVMGMVALPHPPAQTAELASDQQEIATNYERLEAAALRIADLAEPAKSARAEQIRETIRKARKLGVRERFDRVVLLLEAERLSAVKQDQAELASQLSELLRVMLADPNESRLEEERRRIERLTKALRGAIRTQRSLRARSQREATPAEKGSLAEAQGDLADRVESLQDLAPESDPAENAENESSGESQQDTSTPGESGPPSLGGKMSQAQQAMRKAQKQISQGKPQDAGQQQLEAQRDLESALREAEERLKQLREEEKQRLLASLAERLQRLLSDQRGVGEATVVLATANKPQRATQLAAVELADRQSQITKAAERARRIVQEDGASLTFDEALQQATGDMQSIETRLRSVRIGKMTQGLHQSVIAALEEMLAAVDESLREMQRQAESGSPPGGGSAGESSLVSQLAELRMLRSLQRRLKQRTALWSQADEDSEASAGEIAENLRRLASEQIRLSEAAGHAARQSGP